MLLAFGAALSGIALVSVARTSSYLAVAQPVAVGSAITAGDLTTVQLAGGGGLTPIPADRINSVVGLRAAVSLVPGTLLVSAQLTNKTLIGDGQAQIGLGLRSTSLPATHLHPGDQIALVPLQTNSTPSAAQRTDQFPGTVVDVGTPGNDGTLVLHVAVDADDAATIVTLNANGGLGVVLKPEN
jgi:hypothetical protein